MSLEKIIVNFNKTRSLYVEIIHSSMQESSDNIEVIGDFERLTLSDFNYMFRKGVFFNGGDNPPLFTTNDWTVNHFAVSFDRDVKLDYGNIYVPNCYTDLEAYNSFLNILNKLKKISEDERFILRYRKPSDLERGYGYRVYNPLLSKGTSYPRNRKKTVSDFS